ncbi:MAG TPA: hypothetical protein DDX39_00815 [Bacteroidales bacterium]|nr:MAG: hypothetical protein A2W98_08365 [Bacteroidetes bacterium GWF2_33_38]OFY76728.1 MAG: hypothetical protein A2265_02250 [Bacteroidetes bacterium RIFOXYA12_FULL_33_9]OFY88569.1 MAG: hypothetical protein A2236_00225 [Bacteroidetes bacterium RIFOXYA2_FULL_33_7]HBF87152.1 hypothetical protein [Bacteroidales bacterium]
MLARLLTVVLFVLFTINLNAQDTTITVKRSTQKVLVNGKKFYLHTVQKGETLYSISKAYNVLPKDIAIENTNVFEGIKPDQVLNIPIFQGVNSTEEEILSAGKYIVHKVEQSQTLYAISKIYNVTVDEIKSNNPLIGEGIKIGDLIRIPKLKEDRVAEAFKVEPEKEIAKDNNYNYHEVEKKQTLYSIAKMYNVEVEDILKANPDVNANGLKAGEAIRIPKINNVIIEDFKAHNPKSVDTTKFVQQIDSLIQKTNTANNQQIISLPCDSNIKPIVGRPINIALFLPFHAEKNLRVDMDKLVKNEDEFYPNSHFIEFYEGVLLALDTLRKEGKNVLLQVFDTKNDSAKIVEILNKPELKTVDLIIGPSYFDEFMQVSEFAKQHGIYIVSPFLSKQEILTQNPFVFQVIPSITTQLYFSIKNILTKYKDRNFIYVSSANIEKDKLAQIYKKMIDGFVAEMASTITFKEIQGTGSISTNVENAMVQTKENVVFLPFTDQAQVSSIVSRLSLNAKEFKISIVGLPVWEKFENIDLEYFHRINLHSFQPTFVDYTDSTTMVFIKESHFMFKHEPEDPFSFLGYDITRYFVKSLSEYGKNFVNCIEHIDIPVLSTDFEFVKKNAEDGFENQSVKVIYFDREYNISLLK